MSLIASLSNAFSNVADSDFVLRTAEDTQRLIIGTGYGSNVNACMYLRHNTLGINRFADNGNVLDVIDALKVGTDCNVKINNTLYVTNIEASNIAINQFGKFETKNASVSNIYATNVNPQLFDLTIGNSACNIYIGKNSTNPQNIFLGNGVLSTICIGCNNDIITINGSSTLINAGDFKISDKLLTVNDGGNDSSSSGIEISENNSIVGYIKTSLDKSSFLFKTSQTSGEMILNLTNNSANFNNNQLFLSSNGNIGIGNFLPSKKLDVSGDANFSGLITAGTTLSQTNTCSNLYSSNVINSQTITTYGIVCSNASILSITASNISFLNTETNRKLILSQTAANEHQICSIGSANNLVKFQADSINTSFVFSACTTPSTSSELMRILGNGRVGIGTLLPQTKLDVIGDISASNYIYARNITANNGSNLFIDPSTPTGLVSLACQNSNGSLNFFNKHTMTINTLGLGTMTPSSQYLLDVSGSGNFKQLRSSANSGILNITGLKSSTSSLGESTMIGEHIIYNSNTENFSIVSNGTDAAFSAIVPTFGKIRCFVGTLPGQTTNFALSSTNFLLYEQLSITPSGTGIGAANPLERLHVNGNGQNCKLRLSGQSNFTQGIDLYDNSLVWSMYKPSNTRNLMFNNGTNDCVVFSSAGTVGIGVTTTLAKCHIYHNNTSIDVFRAENTSGSIRYQSDGNLKLFNGSGINTWTAPINVSDLTLKHNISNITNSLDIINKLRGVRFDFKPEYNINNDRQIGFIAQEVLEVIPEVVKKDIVSNIYNINYEKITPILVESIKELKIIIDKQSNDILELKRKLAQLI